MDYQRIDDLAAQQRGLITHAQLTEIGLSIDEIRRLRESGALVVLHRGVYRLAGIPLTWAGKVHAASLASESAHVSHRAATGWWRFHRAETDLVELLLEEGVRVRLSGVIAHQSSDLPAADRARHRGLPVTSVERTLIDAGRYLESRRIGEMLDHAVRDGLTTYERFDRRVGELARRGRNGIGTARLVLADRGFGDGWGFEKAMVAAMRQAGLPAPQREFRVHTCGRRYRVDFAFGDSLLGVECDSKDWHGLQYQIDHDLVRQNHIQGEGLLLLRYTARRLRDDPVGVTDEIWNLLIQRRGCAATLPQTSAFPDLKRA